MKNTNNFKKQIERIRKDLEPDIREKIQKVQTRISNENPFKLYVYTSFLNGLQKSLAIGLIISSKLLFLPDRT